MNTTSALITDIDKRVIDTTSCPYCSTELGLPCLDQTGTPADTIHVDRVVAYSDGLLAAVEQMAGIAARATKERDVLLASAVEAGIPTRTVGTSAGLTHTAVRYIVQREQS